MKEGWEYKKLGEVATVSHGKNQKEVEDIHGEYPIYGSGGNIMGYANSYLCESGTTILGRKGTINNPLYIETKFWNVDTAFGITAKDGNSKKYIYYFVKSQDWSKKDTGTTLPSLTQKVVKETIIPVPPLSEQQRIVSYLDATFAKIDAVAKNAEEALNEAKALFQSALTKMMEPKEGWEYKKLGEVCQKTINIKWDEHPNHQYKYIDLSAVDRMTHKVMSTTSICSIDAPSRAKQIVNEGDVLFATTRPTLKRLVIIDKSLDGQICSTGFCVLRPTPAAIMSSWLYYALSNQSFYNYIEPLQKGASYPAVTDNQVKSYKIPVPPLSDQRHIVSYLDVFKSKVDQLQSNLTRTLSECAALKQSILRQTFE